MGECLWTLAGMGARLVVTGLRPVASLWPRVGLVYGNINGQSVNKEGEQQDELVF